MKGFDPICCERIRHYIQGGSVEIRFNDNIGHSFQTRKGSRQGDPLSPIFFNIVADMLTIIMRAQKRRDKLGVFFLTLLIGVFLYYNMRMIRYCLWNMILIRQLILCIFQQLSELKMYFYKSELFFFGKAKDMEHQYKQIFGCESRVLPLRYLGIPRRILRNVE
jgi:hypothetical protein